MTTRYDTSPDEDLTHGETPPRAGWARTVKQLMGIFGAIAAFLGLFIMVAGDDQHLGFWDSTWRVGDINEWWGYGLLIGGGVVLAILIGWMADSRTRRL